MSQIEYPGKDGTPRSWRPFSPATKVGNLLFVSGQASVDLEGNIITDSFEGELRRSMENLKKVLEDCGSGLEHVVQTRNYLGDDKDGAEYNRLYREYFAEPFPARTTIVNCLGTSLKFEIECIAIVPEK